jgi:hypothetical protein
LISGVVMNGATPWIMGTLAGLPIFFIVTILPLLFVSGLKEIYLSSIWTLTYGELRANDLPAPAPMSQMPPGAPHTAMD